VTINWERTERERTDQVQEKARQDRAAEGQIEDQQIERGKINWESGNRVREGLEQHRSDRDRQQEKNRIDWGEVEQDKAERDRRNRDLDRQREEPTRSERIEAIGGEDRGGRVEQGEESFEGLIDLDEWFNNPLIIDRLSRAREFDIGGYKSLTANGEFGRPNDDLDSDEALQNVKLRNDLGVDRLCKLLEENPAMALKPVRHRAIKNLKIAAVRGLTPQQVLDYHLTQMKDLIPDFALNILRRESEAFINSIYP
jgi:hypothetical protein